jgi:hypothetical protein
MRQPSIVEDMAAIFFIKLSREAIAIRATA